MLNEVNLIGKVEGDLREITFGEKEFYSFSLKTWKKYLDSEGQPKYLYNYHLVRSPKSMAGELTNEHLGHYKDGVFQIKGEIKSYKNKEGLFKTYIDSAYIKHVSFGAPEVFND
tara:strand:- start:1563 stop:1904 length:342 start_codon:yes stop_codon:yes gene_type:complete